MLSSTFVMAFESSGSRSWKRVVGRTLFMSIRTPGTVGGSVEAPRWAMDWPSVRVLPPKTLGWGFGCACGLGGPNMFVLVLGCWGPPNRLVGLGAPNNDG